MPSHRLPRCQPETWRTVSSCSPKQCLTCHRVAGKGGRIGPDLSRIGSARTQEAMIREIRTPHEWIPPAYETVTVTTKDGQKVRGVKKNEDAFSIQVMDMRERIQGYLKSNVEVLTTRTH